MTNSIYSIKEVSDSELAISMKSKMELIRNVRATVSSFAEKYGFSRQGIYDAELAISEALANVIEHAYLFDNTGKIELSLKWNQDDELVVNIRDFGRKCNPDEFHSRDLDQLAESGLGIYLMNTLMDEVSFRSDFEVGTAIMLKTKVK